MKTVKKTAHKGQSILDEATVKRIVTMLLPSIRVLLKDYDKLYLHLVVALAQDSGTLLYLFDEPVGNNNQPEKYMVIAHKKATLAAHTGMSTGDVITTAPFLLRIGDVIYQGGVNHHGLIVAASGAYAPWDEAFSWMVVHAIKAHCQVAAQKQQTTAATGGSFLMEKV